MQKINDTQTCKGGLAHVLCMKFERQKQSKNSVKYTLCVKIGIFYYTKNPQTHMKLNRKTTGFNHCTDT